MVLETGVAVVPRMMPARWAMRACTNDILCDYKGIRWADLHLSLGAVLLGGVVTKEDRLSVEVNCIS